MNGSPTTEPKTSLCDYARSFFQGECANAYDYLGAHVEKGGKSDRVTFRVWAPNADAVSVIGDFNGWSAGKNAMRKNSDGVWELTVDGVKPFSRYRYAVKSRKKTVIKSDPFAFFCEVSPSNASVVYDRSDNYIWQATEYESKRLTSDPYTSPMNIYEVNLASWKRQQNGGYYSYLQLAEDLVDYVKKMGYTHVEFMPINEYPFDGSWGYQATGYFAVTSRFGTPNDFKKLVDAFHLAGIGVIVDWVPGHFPKDEHGLIEFDGTCLYEDDRPFRKEHKNWGTRIFDYRKGEVRSFLISSANFLFEEYHVDGLRVDAVSSMLYLDYDRTIGEWQPNALGGNVNLEAVEFIQKLNVEIFKRHPYALMIAEESSAYPLVTAPVYAGGLGFNFKWNMGWMHDTLDYVSTDPLWRRGVHEKITFSMTYAFSENYILPVSHDEVVYGKGSFINKMAGDGAKKFDGVRLFMGYEMAHPGKKLTFMGQETGDFAEWNHDKGLNFSLLDREENASLNRFFAQINDFYKSNDALYSIERSWSGFEWLVVDDRNRNVFCFARRGLSGQEIIAFFNFSGVERKNYQVGVDGLEYKLVFSSDGKADGKQKIFKSRPKKTTKGSAVGKPDIIRLTVKPLTFYYLERIK